MRVQTFMGKIGMESLQQMDEHINHWLESHNAVPKIVTQAVGQEPVRGVGQDEPVVIISVWYERRTD